MIGIAWLTIGRPGCLIPITLTTCVSCFRTQYENAQGYALCSLDKLVVGLLQNVYRASADKVFHKLTQLYYYERKVQSGGVSPATYKSHAQELLHRSGKEVCTVEVESMK